MIGQRNWRKLAPNSGGSTRQFTLSPTSMTRPNVDEFWFNSIGCLKFALNRFSAPNVEFIVMPSRVARLVIRLGQIAISQLMYSALS